MERLEHKITSNFIQLTAKDVKASTFYLEADDRYFRMSRSSRGGASLYPGICILLLSLILLIPGTEAIITFTLYVIFTAFGLFLILYSYFAPAKALVLNRLEGLITIPRFMWMKPVTCHFEESQAFKVHYNRTEGIIATQLTIRHKGNKWRGGRISDLLIDEYWSFFVWYMDKNRPLPPGSAFDPYRQNDYERRKSEGFPRPLYRSDIPTPEATPEQQREREQYWKT